MWSTSLLTLLALCPLALTTPLTLNTVHRRLARVVKYRATQDVAQTSLTLDTSQVQVGLKRDGQQDPADGQTASRTSDNNFINFCLTQKGVPLTNGAQVRDGSCNPTIMGRIIAENAMPSSKFVFPANLDSSLEENQTFTLKMAIKNLQTGHFVNAQSNYFAAPSQVNDQGQLIGHSHVVIQAVPSMNSTALLNPLKFTFFQGLNARAVNGVLHAKVTGGLPAGSYRMGSINTAANHQPALVSVAQHGLLDDVVYFTVKRFSKMSNAGSQAANTRKVAGASVTASTTGSKVHSVNKTSQSSTPSMGDTIHKTMS